MVQSAESTSVTVSVGAPVGVSLFRQRQLEAVRAVCVRTVLEVEEPLVEATALMLLSDMTINIYIFRDREYIIYPPSIRSAE